jgi:hypothetical protein
MDTVTKPWPEAGETKIPYWADTSKEPDQTVLENRCMNRGVEICRARSWSLPVAGI